jgi:hypothetical protein
MHDEEIVDYLELILDSIGLNVLSSSVAFHKFFKQKIYSTNITVLLF